MVLRVRLSVGFAADFAYRFFGASGCAAGMTVVDRYGHLGGVAHPVGDNDFLLAVCRSKGKAAVFVKRDLRAVYGDGVHILFVNGDRLCLAIDFAVLNAGDNRACAVKHNAVRADVVRIAALSVSLT